MLRSLARFQGLPESPTYLPRNPTPSRAALNQASSEKKKAPSSRRRPARTFGIIAALGFRGLGFCKGFCEALDQGLREVGDVWKVRKFGLNYMVSCRADPGRAACPRGLTCERSAGTQHSSKSRGRCTLVRLHVMHGHEGNLTFELSSSERAAKLKTTPAA